MKEGVLIEVRNAQRGTRLDRESLREFADRALQLCLEHRRKDSPATLGHVDVVLVSDARIAAIHKQFMNIPGPTDVITFQHGEIFISVETAKRNARRFKTTTENEVRLYLVHGLLHLLGFDDNTPALARRMEAAQTGILARASSSRRSAGLN